MMKKIKRQSPIVLTFLFIITIFTIFINLKPRFNSIFEQNQIVIKTNQIPILKSHPHNTSTGDTLLSQGHHILEFSKPYNVEDDVWVKGYKIVLRNADQQTLHHLVLNRSGGNDPICPNYPWEPIVLGSTDNFLPIYFPKDYALFIPKGSQLIMLAMFHNSDPPLGPGRTFARVSAEVILYTQKYNPFTHPKQVKLYRLHLSDNPCGDFKGVGETFIVPPTTTMIKKESSVSGMSTSSYTFPANGKIVLMGGHFHPFEGGRDLNVYIDNKLIHAFRPKEISKGTWRYWSIPYFKTLQNIKKKSAISITTTYENTNTNPETGAMGMMGFYYAKD